MGRRGPPPKPTKIKLLQGNAGKRALNKDEPTPPPPSGRRVGMPRWLQGDGHEKARYFWRSIAPVLSDMGVVTTADPHALAMLCDVLAEYVEARALVLRLGMTYESHMVRADTRRVLEAEDDPDDDSFDPSAFSVMIRPRPEVRIASDAWRRARAMMQEFGLTPSARTRVKGEPKDEEDIFESMFGAKKA